MKKFIILLILPLFIACHYGHIQKTVQVNTEAYLEFKGNISKVTFTIDDGSRITPLKSGHATSFKYSLKPGVHELKIYRNNELINKERFYIGSQETKEVYVQ